MAKKVAILGSTGSIGRNALEVIAALSPAFEVTAISAHRSVDLFCRQVQTARPAVAAMTDPQAAKVCRERLGGFKGEILTGPDSLVEIASMPEVDIVVCAVVGAAGLPAALAAARAGKTLAIANKEPLVIAGELLTETARQHGATILPVDSEHSAVFQAMRSGSRAEVDKVILTASGGPFRTTAIEQMCRATVQQALNHPTWSMGPKITVDSASMMNKALEVIEAVWLFGLPVDKIDVLIHPESVVHSMVEFVDGSVIAQLGTPDMKLPIQYALTYPKRVRGVCERLRLDQLGKLTFEPPDLRKFRALALGFEVARSGGSAPVVFNAANEVAVNAFLAGRIPFGTIVELIERSLDAHTPKSRILSLDDLMAMDAWARAYTAECLVDLPKVMIRK
jgi:1-deoxy-D-xylulose-5-phosphate reductoisomerase